MSMSDDYLGAIAIIGLAGRFPGAAGIDELWRNLRDGVESVTFFTDEELIAAGLDAELLAHPGYVKARPVLADPDLFDSGFFGYSPREATLMDPQHRLFLECCWQALEDAGYDAERHGDQVGVFAGVSFSTYLFNLYSNPELVEQVGFRPLLLGNDKDYLATRVSYKLNLRGPSVTVQSACSTSLAAAHLACQALLNRECGMALAGGVTVSLPQNEGYLHQEGDILSPDGHCRAFDARAAGTIGGNGLGVVLLKRLADALADGDPIRAVIRGSAMNNDGSLKVSYTAPSVQAQARVIAEALAIAGVPAESVRYVEAHGTGTNLGDPIEIAALTRAFRSGTEEKGFCAIGSVKTNVGHLDAAAGVTGLIKAALALQHRQIPPSLHFESPNPQLDLENSPFFVNARLADWPQGPTPRRAGVSSFGIGGTNVHMVLEETPAMPASDPGAPWELLVLSARSPGALDKAAASLAAYLEDHPEVSLADVAYTLQLGRKAFAERRTLVCRDRADAVSLLRSSDPKRVFSAGWDGQNRTVAFLFPGQGAQYPGMGRELYRDLEAFRRQIDRGAELLRPHLGCDLRELLFPAEGETAAAAARLEQTGLAQPALFVVEHALARQWMEWGAQPQAMIGHSIGELVAACLAEVFTFEEGVALVAARGRLMQELPPGAMLAVPLSEAELLPLLSAELSLAAVNAPSLCTVSGPVEAVQTFAELLGERGVEGRRLHTSHAFHSAMMEPILEAFAAEVAKVALRTPRLRFISNLTGAWITDDQATDPEYWASHLRRPVRFAEGLVTLCEEPQILLLETGPGETLSNMVRRQGMPVPLALASMRHPQESSPDLAVLLRAAGRLWMAGGKVDWARLHAGRRRRVSLPTYPFERERYWVERRKGADAAVLPPEDAGGKREVADWFYLPVWKKTDPLPLPEVERAESWLVFLDGCGVGARLAGRLASGGHAVLTVEPGERFGRKEPAAFTIDPRNPEDYRTLLREASSLGVFPSTIAHLWGVAPPGAEAVRDALPAALDLGFHSLLFLGQALGGQRFSGPLQIGVVTHAAQALTDEEAIRPERVPALALAKVIPQEYPGVVCRTIDVPLPGAEVWRQERMVHQLLAELRSGSSQLVVAYRGADRWTQELEPKRLEDVSADAEGRLRPGGVYVLLGGFGRIGRVLSTRMAVAAPGLRLVLAGRSALPDRSLWEEVLAQGGSAAERIQHLLALEEKGAEVLAESVDVAAPASLAALFERVRQHCGGIDGVIHAAGDVGEDLRAIQEETREHAEAQLRTKVLGAVALAEALGEEKLGFCVLFSSLAAVLGGLGLASYAAANLFLDAFACQHRQQTGQRWISVGWDAWRFGEAREERAGLGGAAMDPGIDPAEGADAFARLLGRVTGPQIVISTSNLQARLDRWIQLQALRGTGASGGLTLHPRGNLATPYEAPRNELEESMAVIWQELLGIDKIGVHDNFFELGGDSLLAIQLKARLRNAFEVEPPLRALFEKPTVAELAEAIELQLIESLEGLSDEETQRMLESEV
jgi:acyl transferase domain-containing protein/acyl carrier protein